MGGREAVKWTIRKSKERVRWFSFPEILWGQRQRQGGIEAGALHRADTPVTSKPSFSLFLVPVNLLILFQRSDPGNSTRITHEIQVLSR